MVALAPKCHPQDCLRCKRMKTNSRELPLSMCNKRDQGRAQCLLSARVSSGKTLRSFHRVLCRQNSSLSSSSGSHSPRSPTSVGPTTTTCSETPATPASSQGRNTSTRREALSSTRLSRQVSYRTMSLQSTPRAQSRTKDWLSSIVTPSSPRPWTASSTQSLQRPCTPGSTSRGTK